jgi:predicted Zn-dependent protease
MPPAFQERGFFKLRHYQDFYAYTIGGALVEMGRHQEGITVLKRHLAAYPDNLVAHYIMIVAYAELGRDPDARAEAAEVMRISPNFSIASLARYKNMRSHPRWAIDMREAGLK